MPIDAFAAENRRIQEAAIEEHRDKVAGLVRRMGIAERHREEAEHVGLIALLAALGRYEPGRLGPDRGGAFWFFATRYVRDAIRNFMGIGVYWRKDTNRGKSESRQRAARDALRHRTQESMDAPFGEEDASTLHDLITDASPNPEEQVAHAEAVARVKLFLSKLSPADRKAILSESSCHHLDLVQRAAAFVRGSDDDDGTRMAREPLRRRSDTIRP